MKKILLALLFLAFLSSLASGYEITKQELTVQINADGNGTFTEKYYFRFADSEDNSNFMLAVKNNGQNLLAWKSFDSRISPYFESIERISLQGFSFDPNTRIIEMKYASDNSASQKTNEDSRSETWRLKSGLLQNFEQGTLVIVPKSITISIILPQNSTLNSELLPPAVKVTKNSLVLNNARVNNLNIQYSIPKPIAETEIFSNFFEWIKQTGIIYLIIAALTVIGVVAIVKRKELAQKIENYIVENSEISSKDEIEEVDIED